MAYRWRDQSQQTAYGPQNDNSRMSHNFSLTHSSSCRRTCIRPFPVAMGQQCYQIISHTCWKVAMEQATIPVPSQRRCWECLRDCEPPESVAMHGNGATCPLLPFEAPSFGCFLQARNRFIVREISAHLNSAKPIKRCTLTVPSTLKNLKLPHSFWRGGWAPSRAFSWGELTD